MDCNSGCHLKVDASHSAGQEVQNLHYPQTILTETNQAYNSITMSGCRELHINSDEYAVVKDDKQITMVSSPAYEEALLSDSSKSNSNVAPVIVNHCKLEDVKATQMGQSPLHIFAEVSKDKKKQTIWANNVDSQMPINSTISGNQRSPSVEYAVVESKKILPRVESQEEKHQNHYHYSLEKQISQHRAEWAKVHGSDDLEFNC